MPSDGTSIKDPTASPTSVATSVGRPAAAWEIAQAGQDLGALRERPAGDDRGHGDDRDDARRLETPRWR